MPTCRHPARFPAKDGGEFQKHSRLGYSGEMSEEELEALEELTQLSPKQRLQLA